MVARRLRTDVSECEVCVNVHVYVCVLILCVCVCVCVQHNIMCVLCVCVTTVYEYRNDNVCTSLSMYMCTYPHILVPFGSLIIFRFALSVTRAGSIALTDRLPAMFVKGKK